jgi:hypothetical protein
VRLVASLSGKRVVILGSSVGLAIILTMVIGFSKIGRKPFVHAAELTEARNHLAEFGKKLARCGAEAGHLPPSAPGVPAECARFGEADRSGRARFAWRRQSDEAGVVVSYVDMNGDGTEETVLSAVIECKHVPSPDGGPGCWLGPVNDRVDANDGGPPT